MISGFHKIAYTHEYTPVHTPPPPAAAAATTKTTKFTKEIDHSNVLHIPGLNTQWVCICSYFILIINRQGKRTATLPAENTS